MSLKRSLRLIGSGPVLPLTRKGWLSFSAIKIFDDDESSDEFEEEPATTQDLPLNTPSKPSLAVLDCSPRFHIGQPTFRSDYRTFGSDLGEPANPSSNRESLKGIDTAISSYFEHAHNDGKSVVNQHRLPTPQPTPDPPSASTLTSDLSFTSESSVYLSIEAPKLPNVSRDAPAEHEGLIIEVADPDVHAQNLSDMQLEAYDSDSIMNASYIDESVKKVFPSTHDRKAPSSEVVLANSNFTSSITSNEGSHEPSPISIPASANNHHPNLPNTAPRSSRNCKPLNSVYSSKQKRKKHKPKHRDEAEEITAEGNPPEQIRNSLAEYRRQMLGRHRRIDHRPPRKSIFVTIRRD